MKKFKILLCASSLSGAIFFLGVIPAADAQNVQGKWGFGIRAGASFLTQDIAEDVFFPGVTLEGNTGPLVSGNISYGLHENFSAGLNLEWETHSTDLTFLGIDLFSVGDTQTISIMPFVEARAPMGSFVPYGTLGIGVNINSFDEDDIIAPTKVDPDSTFALKIGGGADYFLSNAFALNAELGWKLNKGDATITEPGFPDLTGDFNTSTFSFIAGIRYYH